MKENVLLYWFLKESVELNSGEKILDMGCGTGTIIQRIDLNGRFCTEQEIIQIFKPYGLEIKEKKKDVFFKYLF